MNFKQVEKIADAVLYEGYILYPYRASAVKNQQRFNFGALLPESYCEAQRGSEHSSLQTECLVLSKAHTTIAIKVRFLHLMARDIYQLADAPIADASDDGELASALATKLQAVEALEVDGQFFQRWQEATEREFNAPNLQLDELLAKPQQLTFSFPAKLERELLRDANQAVVGAVIRTQQTIAGTIELQAQDTGLPVDSPERLCKLTVRLLNLTRLDDANGKTRDEALLYALASAHTILGVQGGEFVSLLEPPETFSEAVADCQNLGTYPVLAGEAGARAVMLSSPIILYDYPQIAPESDGDLFDGTEIDEILLLRIMTLTDEEKREMRAVDERARKILDRVESLPPEQLMKLHGALRERI
ncbi:MAG: hypothetical protein AB1757_03295 [Acidobacteriota bacterium]